MNLDYDCDCARVGEKIKIIKAAMPTAPSTRKSTANKYFDETFIPPILNDCAQYYRNWIDSKSIIITPS